jgi:hypothetical protein
MPGDLESTEQRPPAKTNDWLPAADYQRLSTDNQRPSTIDQRLTYYD